MDPYRNHRNYGMGSGGGYFPSNPGYFPSSQGTFPSNPEYFPSGQGTFPSNPGYFPSGQGYFPSGQGYFPSGQGQRSNLDRNDNDTNNRTGGPTWIPSRDARPSQPAAASLGRQAYQAAHMFPYNDDHLRRAMWQTINPASVYRRGRYVPTAAASHPIPMPDFLRRVSADRRSQQPRPEVSRPPRYAPTTNQQVVRVCPQCREVPLGPGPVVNGQPTYPVCEECRQTNIRQQVLRGIAAEALVELSRRAVVHSPGRADREESGPGRDLSEPRPVPKPTQGFLCLRCKRPGVPLAPGRRRCVECICVLVAFGPDKGGQTVEVGNGSNADPRQDEPEHGSWHTCNGCFRNQVPPGEGKCHDCVDRLASEARASTTLAAAAATCVICESEPAANVQAYCNNCEVEGSRGMGASVMLDTKQCTACGEEVDNTADGLCWDCRMPPRSPDERDDEEWLENEIETWEDGPSQQQQQQQQQSGRDKMCGCLRNAARWGRMLCNDCYEALRSVDRRGWADWKRRNWPSKARRVARRREEQSSWR